MHERDLITAIRLALGRYPDVVLWRNSVGSAERILHDGRTAYQRYGLCEGSSDLIGIGPGGRFLALEIKSPSGVVSLRQQQFIDLVNARGGIAAVIRTVEDAIRVITDAR